MVKPTMDPKAQGIPRDALSTWGHFPRDSVTPGLNGTICMGPGHSGTGFNHHGTERDILVRDIDTTGIRRICLCGKTMYPAMLAQHIWFSKVYIRSTVYWRKLRVLQVVSTLRIISTR